MRKRKPMSAETKSKISIANSIALKGRTVPDNVREKIRLSAKKKGIGLWMRGRKISTETRLKMSQSAKGRKWSEETRSRYSKSKKGVPNQKIFVEKHFAWKGDNVGYRALHHRMKRMLGVTSKCSNCGKNKTTPRSIHWSNISNTYRRELSDWQQLCAKCHKEYDKKFKH